LKKFIIKISTNFFKPKIKRTLPINGTSLVEVGTSSASRSKRRKNAVNMFMPRMILDGVSGGSQNTTMVRIANNTQGIINKYV